MHRDRKRHAWFGVAGALALAGAAALPVLLVAQTAPPAPVGLPARCRDHGHAVVGARRRHRRSVHLPARGRQRQRRSESGRRSGAVARTGRPPACPTACTSCGCAPRPRPACSAPSNEIVVARRLRRRPCAARRTGGPGRGNNVAVGWQPSSGATGYVLEVGSAPGAANLAVVPLGGPGIGAPVPERHLLRARPGGERVRLQRAVGRKPCSPRRGTPRRRHRRCRAIVAAAVGRAVLAGGARSRHPRHLQRRGARPLRDRRWRRRLPVPHLARAGRSRRAASSRTSTATTRAIDRERRDPRLARAGRYVRLHRAPACRCRASPTATRSRTKASRCSSPTAATSTTRAASTASTPAVGVPHGHRRADAVQHAAPLRRHPPDPPGVRAEGVHPADDEHRRRRCGLRSAQRQGAGQGRRAARLAVPAEQRLRDLEHPAVGPQQQRPRGLPLVRHPGGVRPDHRAQSGQPHRAGLRLGLADGVGARRSRRTTGRITAAATARATRSRATGTTATAQTVLLHRPDGATGGVQPSAMRCGRRSRPAESIGAPATTDGLHQFKMRRDYCEQRSRLGLKN